MQKKKVKILGINGSPHKDGICANLLKKVLAAAKEHGAQTEIVHLVDTERSFYHSGFKKKPEKDFAKLSVKIKEADGLVLATPVMWMNVSSLMKNFIEKLTYFEVNNYDLEGKVAAFVTTEDLEGGWKTALDMAGPLNHMGLIIPPYAMLFYNRKLAHHVKAKWMKRDVELLGKNLVVTCKMVRREQPIWHYRGEFRKWARSK